MYSPHRHKYFIFLAVIVFILSSVLFSDAKTIKYTYDDLNRLCAVQYGDDLVIQYGYDEAGNRRKKNVFKNSTPTIVPGCIVLTAADYLASSDNSMKPKVSDKKSVSKSSTKNNGNTATGPKTYTIIGTKNTTNGDSSSSGANASLPKGDFNNDGQADILWRNNATGENKIWLMDGTSVAQEVNLEPVIDTNYKIAATGDFNNDGKTDIIWRNNVTGDNMIWLMNGTERMETLSLSPMQAPDWTVAALKDFNDDGFTDILWRNQLTGENNIWLMDGIIILQEIVLETLPAPDWIIGK